MSIPVGPVAVPAKVLELAHGAAVTPAWRNELGGLSFRTDDGRYIKWGPRNPESRMIDEAERMRWAAAYARVPAVIDVGADDAAEWLVTAAIPGESAVAPRWIADPAAAVAAVGRGLRILHDALPVAACPYSWQVDLRLRNAQRRGIRIPDHLLEPPPVDALVVSHGDACCPNTILDEDGTPMGHVDLAALGLADRWADIAVASMSTAWNYGPGWEDALIAAYGIEPDRGRIDYYRELWNAT